MALLLLGLISIAIKVIAIALAVGMALLLFWYLITEPAKTLGILTLLVMIGAIAKFPIIGIGLLAIIAGCSIMALLREQKPAIVQDSTPRLPFRRERDR